MTFVRHKDIGILPYPGELRAAGWSADFALIEDDGMRQYYGVNVYSTREEAMRASLDSARRIIDDD